VPRAVWIGGLVGGAIDVMISSGVAAQIGVVAAAVAAVAITTVRLGLSVRRIGAVAAVTIVCGLGVLALRGSDFAQYVRFLGLATADRQTTQDVQTYAHRQLIYYIGLKVWLAHPVLGAGWQSFREAQVYTPVLDDAHRRFPDEPEQAFPAPDRQYGIDNAYIQVAAELGLVGLMLFLGLLGTGLVMGASRALRAPPFRAQQALVGLLWLLVVMGTWAGQGLGAGSAFAALSWFALGLVAAAGSPADA
jgi:O-antigen ligase